MSKMSEDYIYDFEVFRALVELEIRRIERYKKSDKFSIAFLYAPNLAREIEEKKPESIDIVFKIRNHLRSTDIISPVEEDFVFLFFPETGKENVETAINRIKNVFKDKEIIKGIASYPEDGKDKYQLFNKLVDIMNQKLIPVIELHSGEEKP
ncbi:hypothetical protein [Persephonella sp.]